MNLSKLESCFSVLLLYAAGGCFLFGTSVTVTDVALRAMNGANVPAAIELTSLSIGLGALLSMPVCYAERAHVTARLLSELSPSVFGKPLSRLGAAASLIFAAMLFGIVADNTWEKLGSAETTTDLGLPLPIALSVVTVTLGVAIFSALSGAVSVFHSSTGEEK